jgi:hypothetical protein
METTDQSPQNYIVDSPVVNNTMDNGPMLPFKFSPKMKWLLSILLVIILLNFGVMFFKSTQQLPVKSSIALLPSNTPSVNTKASGSANPAILSEFSRLPEFIQFDTDLKSTIAVNDNLDLSTSKINFPLLEMNINFKP